MMKYMMTIMAMATLALTGCSKKSGIAIEDVYAYATPQMGAVAVFMTVENNTDTDDRLTGFVPESARRAELHTMSMNGDIMQMRRVEGYDIAAGETLSLDEAGNHIMIFDRTSDWNAGDTFKAVATFEKAGEVPVTIMVRDRKEATNSHQNH